MATVNFGIILFHLLHIRTGQEDNGKHHKKKKKTKLYETRGKDVWTKTAVQAMDGSPEGKRIKEEDRERTAGHVKTSDAWICRGARQSISRRTERGGRTASPDVQQCTGWIKY